MAQHGHQQMTELAERNSSLAVRTYVPVEDIETANSSVEDIVPLVGKQRASERRLRFDLGSAAATAASRSIAPATRRGPASAEAERRRSLPSSPFLTSRRVSPDSPALQAASGLITAEQVKRALAVKSQRYRRGDFQPMGGKPAPPQPTPAFSSGRRLSRSLPDVASFLHQARQIHQDQQRMIRERQQRLAAQRRQRRSKRNRPPLPPHAKAYATTGRPTSSASGSTTASAGVHPPHAGNWATVGRRPPRHASITRLSSSGTSRCGSQDTLRASPDLIPTTSSVHSGDPELEFDLYDCNLDNVVAGHPSSFFAAPVLWSSYLPPTDDDLTPTGELFPRQPGEGEETPQEEMEVLLRRPTAGPASGMADSRTSDLTASVTSADLSVTREDLSSESDRLLGHTFSSARPKPNAILNLTHIDDDISFADSSGDEAPSRSPWATTTC